MEGNITMDRILGAGLGESSGRVVARFKKTVNIAQYETEVIEAEAELQLENGVSGAERMVAQAILQAQLEYTAFVNLAFKHHITNEQLGVRRSELENGVKAIVAKAEAITGKPMDKYL